MKICKDGRIWGQSNKFAGDHLGVLKTPEPYIKKGYNLNSAFPKGDNLWSKGEKNYFWQGGEIQRFCEICGKEFFAKPYRAKEGNAKFCSRSCLAKSHTQGKNNPSWKGGITPLYAKIRSLPEYRQWRSDVFQRDNWICRTCGLHSGCGKTVYLEAHHIKEFAKIMKENNIANIIEAQLCEELWNIDNGVTLCEDCHKLTRRKQS